MDSEEDREEHFVKLMDDQTFEAQPPSPLSRPSLPPIHPFEREEGCVCVCF